MQSLALTFSTVIYCTDWLSICREERVIAASPLWSYRELAFGTEGMAKAKPEIAVGMKKVKERLGDDRLMN